MNSSTFSSRLNTELFNAEEDLTARGGPTPITLSVV